VFSYIGLMYQIQQNEGWITYIYWYLCYNQPYNICLYIQINGTKYIIRNPKP
jgi:hypothetical protein